MNGFILLVLYSLYCYFNKICFIEYISPNRSPSLTHGSIRSSVRLQAAAALVSGESLLKQAENDLSKQVKSTLKPSRLCKVCQPETSTAASETGSKRTQVHTSMQHVYREMTNNSIILMQSET